MTTIDERAARQREGRRHWHCSVMGCWIIGGPLHGSTYRLTRDARAGHTKHPRGRDCTDRHGDPIETALDALALAYDVLSPEQHWSERAGIRATYLLLADGGE